MTLTLTHTIITIAGDLGSGKSVVGKFLAKKTGYNFHSTGELQRNIASKYGITTLELNKRSETTFKYDEEIDASTKQLSESGESFFMDSRMAWYFIPQSFKIYLQVDLDIAAQRIFGDTLRKNEKYPTLESAKNDIIHRKNSEHFRFKKYYHVDCENPGNYDLIIDTSYSTPEEISDIILNNLSPEVPTSHKHKFWFPPRILHPSVHPKEIQSESSLQLRNEIKTNGYDFGYAIDAFRNNGTIYISNGHKRISAALYNKISLIPVNIIAQNNEEIKPDISVHQFIQTDIDPHWFAEWKELHSFAYQ